MTTKIKAVYLPDPPNGESTDGAHVGYAGVTQIIERVEYGILWLDVFAGDVLIKSYNAAQVAVVNYVKGA